MPMFDINPGSGPVQGGDLAQARANMEVFIHDALGEADDVARIVGGEPEEDGRFLFYVESASRRVPVSMPGLPLKQVRYMHPAGRSMRDFPRLFVDGASWVWLYGCRALCRKLGEREGESVE